MNEQDLGAPESRAGTRTPAPEIPAEEAPSPTSAPWLAGNQWGRSIAFKGAGDLSYLDGIDGPILVEAKRTSWYRERFRLLAERERTDRTAAITNTIFTIAAILGVTAFVIWQLRPGLLFGPNMDVGGDNGGHVAAPYYMIHDLLPHGRITGWDPQWFDGFPLYVFYFPLPAVLVAILNLVFPYAVAFKLVTVLGTMTLPVCVWAFGKLGGFLRPIPELMAAASIPYLFNTSYTIDGGNIASTMAGEFSFSLALSFGMLFLGFLMYSLRTGRLRWLVAVLFAATVLCHIVAGLAFAGFAVVFVLAYGRLRGLKVLLPAGICGGLLAGFWLVPFGVYVQYSSSMGYLTVPGSLASNLLPEINSPTHEPSAWLLALVPAILGGIAAVLRRDRFACAIVLCATAAGTAFAVLPSGTIYNGRWLPFWFLFLLLAAAYAVGLLCRAIAAAIGSPWTHPVTVTVLTIACLGAGARVGGLTNVPGIQPVGSQTPVGGWIQWNYNGFQAKSGWPEFQAMTTMMDKAGAKYGCGRLQYEYISETNVPFGSTEAMMAIPLFTGGCMQATDGIYFESSSTTPFHFLDVSEVSQDGEAPDPVSGLSYPGYDLPDGIRHLQFMGVKYFFAMSPMVEADAAADPSLVQVGSTPGFAGKVNGLPDPHPVWKLYLIKDSPLVTSLPYYPVVESSSSHRWLGVGVNWYESEQYWPVEIVRSGPESWRRAKIGTLVPTSQGVPTPSTSISDVKMGNSSISFDVSRIGSPVAVKIPYFPNWQATGASGPYEATPNVMVVVPTSHHVTLAYGTTSVDWAGKIASLAGVAGTIYLGVRPATETGPDAASAGSLGAGATSEDSPAGGPATTATPLALGSPASGAPPSDGLPPEDPVPGPPPPSADGEAARPDGTDE